MKCRPEETKLIYASFKHVMPEAFVCIEELPGKHCNKARYEDGSLMLVEKVCTFLAQEEVRNENN